MISVSMEDLSKTQIVLLCLLVSFVTSIGTGIISFSLLSEVPQTITQTINRVVERTIEKVVPVVTPGDKTIQKEITTVVVKEDDLVMEAIAKNEKSIVRISTLAANTSASSTNASIIYGLGLIVTKDGVVVADAHAIDATAQYIATLSDGKKYTLSPMKSITENPEILFFEIKKEKDDKTIFTPATLGNSDGLQLGQTVIAISGIENSSVTIGYISGLKKSVPDASGAVSFVGIETDIISKNTITGGPLLNLSGQVIGLTTLGATGSNAPPFTPINLIQSALLSQQNSSQN